MIPKDFQDRLQRFLAGELSEAECRQLYQELLGDPAALEEFLAVRAMDHDLKRLLAPGSSDEAFLRGLLNARSTKRQDPEAFIQSVTRAHSQGGPRKTARRKKGSLGIAFLAAGVLIGAVTVGFVLSNRSGGGGPVRAALPKPAPAKAEEKTPALQPVPAPAEVARPPEQRPEPVPSPVPAEPPAPKTTPETPEKEKTPPEAPASPPKTAPRPTVTAYATLQKAKGNVFVFTGSPARKSPASEGQPLAPGEGVLTEGGQSSAFLARHDATQLSLGADTRIAFAEARSEIALFQGKLDIEAGQDILVTTPHAEVRAQACRLTLTSGALSTGLELHKGAAMFTNVGDGRTIEVKPGQRVFAQDPPGVDRKRVDEAIRKGVAYLKSAPSQGVDDFAIANCDELILLTLLSAGLGESDAMVQNYLKNILSAPLGRTYLVSLQAMVLEELDRVKYQDRIAECAQFLVDNQSTTGQWTYAGTPSPVSFVAETPAGTATSGKAAADLFGRRAKPMVVRKLKVKKTRSGGDRGDNSNAQYAALGLRACSEAGIAIPAETLELAAGWWRKCQYAEDGGRGVASGPAGPARGWCYNDGKNPVNNGPCCVGPYSSMTAGAVCSLIIYDHLLGADWKKDVSVRLGMNWMANYFTVARNFNIDQSFKAVNGGTTPPETYLYYGLYALERVGILSAQEKLGRHAWYAEGSKFILGRQKADGSWREESESTNPTWDTCFAILFLKRSTRPLADVASEDRSVPKTPKEK